MARISTYDLDNSIDDGDKLIGTDVKNQDITKNFTLLGVAEYVINKFIGSGNLDLYMLKSVYDPANRAEQVLTVTSVIDSGTIT